MKSSCFTKFNTQFLHKCHAYLLVLIVFFAFTSESQAQCEFTCPDDVLVGASLGKCTQEASWNLPTLGAGCTGFSIVSSSHDPGDTFPVGTTTVTYTASNGVTDVTCSFDVIVVDNESPTLTCPPNITVSSDPGACTASVAWPDPTVNDNCMGATIISNTHNPGEVFPLGFTFVTYVAEDAFGNTATCTFYVHVIDVTEPQVVCPQNITVNNDAGACGANVTWTPPSPIDNCLGVATTSSTHNPGDFFPVGTTIVTYDIEDAAGNTTSCSFEVTVSDSENAVLTCPANVTVSTDPGSCQGATVNWDLPTLTDNCSAEISSSTHMPGDFFNLGATTVTYIAIDGAGNEVTCSFEVLVLDMENPTIACPADISIAVDRGECAAVANWSVPVPMDNCAGVSITSASHNPGDTFPVGMTIVSYTATDAAGNTTTCSFNVTVQDLEAPELTCPINVKVPASGSCEAVANWTIPIPMDNCPGATIVSASHTPGQTFPIGSTTVEYVATDASGNSTTCTFEVLVADTQSPAVACPLDLVVSTDPATCEAVVDFDPPQILDNCPDAMVTAQSHMSGDIFPLGTTTVSFEVTDASGNMAACTFDITVEDNEPPSIVCPADITINTNPGACEAQAIWDDPVTDDNCPGSLTLDSDFISGNTFELGTTTVTYTVTDAAGNTATCDFTVTVIDNEPPVLVCPPNVTVFTTPGNCDAPAEWDIPEVGADSAPSLNDNCPNPMITGSTHNPGDIFPIGSTTVTYTAVDASGNTTECSFEVIVEECAGTGVTEEVTLISDLDVFIDGTDFAANTPYLFTDPGTPGATVSNISLQLFFRVDGNSCESDIEIQVTDPAGNVNTFGSLFTGCLGPAGGLFSTTIQIPSGSILGSPADWVVEFRDTNDQNPGVEYTVRFGRFIYDVMTGADGCANPMILNCPADVSIVNEPNLCGGFADIPVPQFGVDFVDCFDATISNDYTNTNDGSGFYPVGTTLVTWTVTDEQGNTTTCIQSVTVTDVEDPEITCPENIVVSTALGACGAFVTWDDPVVTDNCPGVQIIPSTPSGTIFLLGTTTITYNVTDLSGNTAECSFTVTVEDNQAPSLSCPEDVTAFTSPGTCDAPAEWEIPTFSDNCPGGMITGSTHNPGDIFPIGTTEVTYTAVDAAGNESTCSFNVIIEECAGNAVTETITLISDQDIFVGIGDMETFSENAPYLFPDSSPAGANINNATLQLFFRMAGNSCESDIEIQITDPAGNSNVFGNLFTGCLGTAAGLLSTTINIPNASTNGGGQWVVEFRDNNDQNAVSDGVLTTNNPAGTEYTVRFGRIVYESVTGDDGCANPIIVNCPADLSAVSQSDLCGAFVDIPVPEFGVDFTDCFPATIVNDFTGTSDASGLYPVGTTIVTWTVTDEQGNTTTCQQVVTVTDETPPTVTCPEDIVTTTALGACGAFVTWDAPIVMDNCPGVQVSASIEPGTIFLLGTTTVTYTVSDISGNTATCSFTVTVEDNEAPVLDCSLDPVRVADAGVCTFTMPGIGFDPTATDNCDEDLTFSNDFTNTATLMGATFPVGVTTVVWTVTDESGNSATCAIDIEILDEEAPTIDCSAIMTIRENDPGVCTFTMPGIGFDPAFDDNCPGATISNDFNDTATLMGATFPVGVTTVVWTVTDGAGNTATCSIDITIEDTEAPVVDCSAIMPIRENDPGVCSFTMPGFGFDPTFGDNCPGLTIENDFNRSASLAGATFPVGTTTVVWTVTDAAGNTATCDIDIVIEDTEAPVLTCPETVTAFTTMGTCDAAAEWDLPALMDNCPGGMITGSTHNPGDIFPIGTTTVTYTAVDAAGNTTECSFDVVVEECAGNAVTETITLISDQDIFVGMGDMETFSENLPYLFPDSSPAGATISNATLQLFFRVAGNSCESDVEVQVTDPAGNANVFTGIFASCNGEAGGLFNTTLNIPNASTNGGGQWVVEFRDNNDQNAVSDGVLSTNNPAGTEYTVRFGRIVYQSTTGEDGCALPIIANCPADVSANSQSDICGAFVDIPVPQFGVDFTDCFPATIINDFTGTSDASGLYPVGTTIVTWTVTDEQGNTATCLQVVTVTDVTPPTITCPEDVVASTAAGACGAVVGWPLPEFSDNCPGPVITSTAEPGAIFLLGTTTVTYSITDLSGNTTTCSFTVTVEDTEAPEVTCPADITVFTTPGSCDAVADWNLPTITDNCDASPVITSESHTSGSTFPIGTTTVTYTVEDESGNVGTCSFDVIVEECMGSAETEEITLISDLDVFVGQADTESFADNATYLFTDPGTPAGSTISNITLQLFFRVNGSSCESEIEVQVTDPAGNIVFLGTPFATCNGAAGGLYIETINMPTASTTGATANWIVEFRDTNDQNAGAEEYTARFGRLIYDATSAGTLNCATPVIVNCPADVRIDGLGADCSTQVDIPEPIFGTDFTDCFNTVATNDYNGTSDASGLYPVGTTSVTWTFTDEQGNTATCIQTITITDVGDPEVVCPNDIVSPTDAGACGANVFWNPPVTSDNCGAQIVSQTHEPGDFFGIGTTTVTYIIQDPAGNMTECSFDVTVEDTEAPVVVCPTDILVTFDAGSCDAVVTWDAIAVNDNCPGASITSMSSNSGDTFPLGTTEVIVEVVDAAGNVASCSFNVTVIDNEVPVIINCPADIEIDGPPGECEAAITIPVPMFGTDYTDCQATTIASNDYNGSSNASDTYPIGETVVTWTFTDPSGNTVACQQTITIIEQNLETDAVLVTDQDVFVGDGMDNADFNESDSILIFDPGVPANATVNSVILDFFFRPEGNSCERDVEVEVTDPAGNVFPIFAPQVTTCTGNDAIFQFTLPLASIPTAASGGGNWKLRFRDTQDQNPVSAGSPGAFAPAGTEFSVRFGRITYDITIDPDCDTAVPCASGGIITAFDETTTCAGDGIPDQLIFTRSSQLGANDGWLITDAATGQILSPGVVAQGMNQFTTPDLDGAGVGVCRVYSVSWNGTLSNADMGGNIEDIMASDCLSFSNGIDINRIDCPGIVVEDDGFDTTTIGTTVNDEMKLYPVPTTSMLNVEYSVENNEKLYIQVLNTSGQVLDIQEQTAIPGMNIYQLDVIDLLGGVYYLKVVDSKGNIQVKPFTKITP